MPKRDHTQAHVATEEGEPGRARECVPSRASEEKAVQGNVNGTNGAFLDEPGFAATCIPTQHRAYQLSTKGLHSEDSAFSSTHQARGMHYNSNVAVGRSKANWS
eukprot:6062779-Pleurochrysis_carterae.AAC.2